MVYDAIVVGARCAGSPTAMLLARKGYRVLLVDRATFPSDVISTHGIHAPGVSRLKGWGLLDQVIASNCPPVSRLGLDLGPFSLVGQPPLLLQEHVSIENGQQGSSNVDQPLDCVRHPGNAGGRKTGEDLTHDPCRGRAHDLADSKDDGVKRGGVSHLY